MGKKDRELKEKIDFARAIFALASFFEVLSLHLAAIHRPKAFTRGVKKIIERGIDASDRDLTTQEYLVELEDKPYFGKSLKSS